jgi:hypothetical protein
MTPVEGLERGTCYAEVLGGLGQLLPGEDGTTRHVTFGSAGTGAQVALPGTLPAATLCTVCTSCPVLWTIALPVAEVTWGTPQEREIYVR